jgi:hypothetical protein
MRWSTVLGALAVGIRAVELFAQTPQQGMEGRGIAVAEARCQAAAVAVRGDQAAQLEVLREGIRRCNRSGVDALMHVWADPPDRGNRLAELVARSQELHDRRIMEAVLRIAEDQTRPEDHRFAALSGVLTYLLPTRRAPSVGWYGEDHWGDEPRMFGSRSRAFWMEGEQPIDAEARARMLQVLNRVAETSTRDVRVPNVARAILLTYEAARSREPR